MKSFDPRAHFFIKIQGRIKYNINAYKKKYNINSGQLSFNKKMKISDMGIFGISKFSHKKRERIDLKSFKTKFLKFELFRVLYKNFVAH